MDLELEMEAIRRGPQIGHSFPLVPGPTADGPKGLASMYHSSSTVQGGTVLSPVTITLLHHLVPTGSRIIGESNGVEDT